MATKEYLISDLLRVRCTMPEPTAPSALRFTISHNETPQKGTNPHIETLPYRHTTGPLHTLSSHSRDSWAQARYRTLQKQGITPGAPRRYAPVDGSSIKKFVADLRPSADGSAVRTSMVSGGG